MEEMQNESIGLNYVEQLDLVINGCMQEESILFSEDEMSVIQDYRNLDVVVKEVWFRLLNHRKYKWERLDKLVSNDKAHLRYAESVDVLKDVEFVDFLRKGDSRRLDVVIDVASRDELVEVAKNYGVKTVGVKKDQLKASIIASSKTQSSICNWLRVPNGNPENIQNSLLNALLKVVGPVFQLKSQVREVFHRLFVVYFRVSSWPEDDKFMNSSIMSNLSENHASKYSFVPYKVHRTSLVWPSRDAFCEYFDALKLEQQISDEIHAWNNGDASSDNWGGDIYEVFEAWQVMMTSEETCVHVTGILWFQTFTRGWVLTRIIESLARQYQKTKKHHSARLIYEALLSQNVFRLPKRGRWSDEHVKIMEHHDDVAKCIDVCKSALNDPYVRSGHRSNIEKRLARLSNRFKRKKHPTEQAEINLSSYDVVPSVVIQGVKVFSETGKKALYLNSANEGVTVEELALDFYAQQGWCGLHTENSIVTTMFGIMYWDIIFDDSIPGVFASRFQGDLDCCTKQSSVN